MKMRFFCILLYTALVLVCGYIVGQCKKPEIKTITEVVELRDTITIERPVEVTKTIKERVLVPVRDTITIHDTTFIALPKEIKQYKSDDYEAQVSGIQPALDFIKVYPKTRIINTTQTVTTRKKVGFSVGIGPSVIYSPFHNSIDAGVGVFGGLTYTF